MSESAKKLRQKRAGSQPVHSKPMPLLHTDPDMSRAMHRLKSLLLVEHVGLGVGRFVCIIVGRNDGLLVSTPVGRVVGGDVGNRVGFNVGLDVGAIVPEHAPTTFHPCVHSDELVEPGSNPYESQYTVMHS